MSPSTTRLRLCLAWVVMTAAACQGFDAADEGASGEALTTLRVASVTLIAAQTGQSVNGFDPLPDGATLTLSQLPTSQLSLRANTIPTTVGSVRFALDGFTHTESFAPYSLCGDSGPTFTACPQLGVGSHTLTVTAYSAANATGTAGPPLTLRFAVQATGPQVTLSVATLDLGDVAVGAASSIQTFTVHNAGTTQASLTSAMTGADFDFGGIGTCNTTLAAGQSCTISVVFRPTAAGARTGQYTLTTGAGAAPLAVALEGRGTQAHAELAWMQGTAAHSVTYDVYRATGPCGGTFSGTRIVSGLTQPAYTDASTVGGHTYCYAVSELDTVSGLESTHSNNVTAVIP